MPDPQLLAEYEHRLTAYRTSVERLVPLLLAMALDSLRDVLPGTHRLEVEGRINEDWIPTLRVSLSLTMRAPFSSTFGSKR